MSYVENTRASFELHTESLVEAIRGKTVTVADLADYLGFTEGYVCAILYSVRQQEDCGIAKDGEGKEARYSMH